MFECITTLPRWKGVFRIDERNKKISLNAYSDVEALIDLLDERYTRSDVTLAEYDTGVKSGLRLYRKNSPFERNIGPMSRFSTN